MKTLFLFCLLPVTLAAMQQSSQPTTQIFCIDPQGNCARIGRDGQLPGSDKTLLHLCAASVQNTKEIPDLVKRGIPVDALGDEGDTPLMIAAVFDNYEAAQLLFACDADASLCNDKGDRAWDFVEAEKNPQMIELFKKHNAHKYHLIGWAQDNQRVKIEFDNRLLVQLPREKKEHFLNILRDYKQDPNTDTLNALRRTCMYYGFLRNEAVNLNVYSKSLHLWQMPIPFKKEKFKNLSREQVHGYVTTVSLYLTDPRNPDYLVKLINECKKCAFL